MERIWYRKGSDNSLADFTYSEALASDRSLVDFTDGGVVTNYDGKTYLAGELPPRPVTYADYDNAMEAHLDEEKAARGYTKREPSDYAGSSNARWAQDAQDWIAHRDAVMAYGLEIENKAKRGEAVPTLDEFKAALPVIQWTVEMA